jgi:CubicO group peptidase (beta-lactamase class C family)
MRRGRARVEGTAAPGFEAVADELQRSLDEDAAGGAALAAVVDGQPVVDLWGGDADARREPWQRDTLQLVFSGTKGFVALCLLMLIDRGVLALEAPVSRYWPAFAAAGKERVTVGQVVSHTAGLPGLRGGFHAADLLDGGEMTERIAAEAPFWAPGSRLAYHALTFGWLADGLVRRVDGRSVGRFFADEVASPLELELWIGLPPELEPRVAELLPADDFGLTYLGEEPEPLLEAVYGDLWAHAFPWNEAAFHQAEIPAANAIGTARSIARLYGCVAQGGELDGVTLLSPEAVRLGRRELSRGVCAVTRRPYAYGVGLELQTELMALGPMTDAFGHTGSGGSRHGCWPSERVGFSYAINVPQPEARDVRAQRLLAALGESLSRRG